jgi:hypothetical protein
LRTCEPSSVIFYNEYESEPDADNAKADGKRRVARASYVFNASQVDGFTAPDAPAPLGPVERLQAVDAFIAATGARTSMAASALTTGPRPITSRCRTKACSAGRNNVSRRTVLRRPHARADLLERRPRTAWPATWESVLAMLLTPPKNSSLKLSPPSCAQSLASRRDTRGRSCAVRCLVAQADEGRQPRDFDGCGEGVGGGCLPEEIAAARLASGLQRFDFTTETLRSCRRSRDRRMV